MTESLRHLKAKERIARILTEAGYKNVQIEKQLPVYAETYQGPKPRIADVYAELMFDIVRPYTANTYIKIPISLKICIEIDGKYHNEAKDDFRDSQLLEKNIKTARIPLDWFKRGKTSDGELLAHIEYQLQK